MKTWAPIAISLIALVNPLVVLAWRRFFRPGSVDIYKTGLVEVGYAPHGPTVAVLGTLRANNRDLFVSRVTLQVEERDRAQHLFEWNIFKPRGGGQSFELPAGFMITRTQPQFYYIEFMDTDAVNQMRPHINSVLEAWSRALSEGQARLDDPDDLDVDELYDDFQNRPEHVNAYTALDRICYWEPGRYTLRINVETARPAKVFEHECVFHLSEADSQGLRLNALRIVQQVCGTTGRSSDRLRTLRGRWERVR